MKKLEELIGEIEKFEDGFKENHPLMVCAEEVGDEELTAVAGLMSAIRMACASCIEGIKSASLSKQLHDKNASSELSVSSLEEMAAIAEEFDKSGDPLLVRQASVLDQILLTLAAPKNAKEVFKLSEDKEIERLRAKYHQEDMARVYKRPKEELDKDIKVADAVKAINDSIKEYRPLEAPLSTRTCPDHPGAQVCRIGDSTYQCEMDGKIYNYNEGFTTMKGNKVPGGEISNQTLGLNDQPKGHMGFDTRESKLNA